jgi:hypothetical protein
MANSITAGNSSNGGTAIVTDTSGTLNIVTGSGSGSNAITIDASQNVTFANAISVAGSTTITGALAVTGSITASGGVSGSITSGTAVTASGTSVNFTGIPSGVKRITVMFNGVSTSGSSNPLIQIGSGSFTTSSYLSASNNNSNLSSTTGVGSTSGYIFASGSSANILYGNLIICNISGNSWVASHSIGLISSGSYYVVYGGGASPALSGALDRVRITTVNGTDTFDAGSINILFE